VTTYSEPCTIEELRDRYEYQDGFLYWRKPDTKRARKSGPLGTTDAYGYSVIKIAQKMVKVHRAIWAHQIGRWPSSQVDHRDGDRANNVVSNLRLASPSENGQNRSGAGFGFDPRCVSRPWQARLRINGESKHLGMFATKEQAHAAYLAAKPEMHPAWASGRGSVSVEAA